MPQVIKEHLSWITGYCACATDDNWRDILDRIQHQIEQAQRDAQPQDAPCERDQYGAAGEQG